MIGMLTVCIAVAACIGTASADWVSATVPTGSFPSAAAVNPVTNKIYITDEAGDDVTVIDGATNVTTTVSAGDRPLGVAVNPVTNKIYVANWTGNRVTVIDGATNAEDTTISAGTAPYAGDE
jgi:YVTN family beta-propeller protein